MESWLARIVTIFFRLKITLTCQRAVDLGVDHLELGLGVAGTLEHFLARVVGRGLAGVCQSSGAESLHLQVPQPAGPNRLTQRERQGGWKRETHIHARAERERERERETHPISNALRASGSSSRPSG